MVLPFSGLRPLSIVILVSMILILRFYAVEANGNFIIRRYSDNSYKSAFFPYSSTFIQFIFKVIGIYTVVK